MGEKLREAAEADLLRVWKALATGRPEPTAGVQERDGLLLVSTGLPLAFFNGAFVRPGADAADPREGADALEAVAALDAADAFFAERPVPHLFRVSPDRPDVAAALAERGLKEVPALLLMAGAIPAVLPEPPAGLELERVDDAARLGRHAALLAASFELPLDVMVGFLADVPLRDPCFLAFNALLDGEPVAASAVYVADGVAGVYDVATLPHRRSRGLGEAVTWHAVREGARHGAAVAVLQPSPMGLPVYTRMGFAVVAEWRQFLSAPPAGS